MILEQYHSFENMILIVFCDEESCLKHQYTLWQRQDKANMGQYILLNTCTCLISGDWSE
jgi:hypothetical protein